MSEQYDLITLSVSNTTTRIVEKIIQNRENCQEIEDVIFESLRQLVNDFGTMEYAFNLSIEEIVEKTSPIIEGHILNILHKYLPENLDMFNRPRDLDALFAAFYALSLIYKKTKNIDGLKSLLDDRYNWFNAYPLKYEVWSRCYKRIGDLKEALACDRKAIYILTGRNVINFGVCISFASTICSMLENNHEVESKYIKEAGEYIEKAIEFNPKYAKYYFIKAKFLFFY